MTKRKYELNFLQQFLRFTSCVRFTEIQRYLKKINCELFRLVVAPNHCSVTSGVFYHRQNKLMRVSNARGSRACHVWGIKPIHLTWPCSSSMAMFSERKSVYFGLIHGTVSKNIQLMMWKGSSEEVRYAVNPFLLFWFSSFYRGHMICRSAWWYIPCASSSIVL